METSKEVLHTQGEWEAMAFDLQCLATNKLEWENERQRLIDSNRELIETLERLSYTFSKECGTLASVIKNAKNILPCLHK